VSISITRTTLECLHYYADTAPERTFLIQPKAGETVEWTWQQVRSDAQKIATAMNYQGIVPGDRVVIWSKNCAEWMIADFAIMMLGAVSVPVYPGQSEDSVHYVFDHSEAKLVIVGKQDDDHAVEQTLGGRSIPSLAMDYYTGPAEVHWSDCLTLETSNFIEYRPFIDDLMTIVYTSGTTGNPKGVMHSYRSYGETCQMFNDVFDANANHRFFSYLPLAHLAERIIVQGNSIYCGAPVYFAESLETFVGDIQRASPTVFFAIPRIWEKFREKILGQISEEKLSLLLKIPLLSWVIKNKIKKTLGLDKAEVIGCGAAPVSQKTLKWFEALGINILEGYGMTENSCYGTLNIPKHRYLTSVGKPLPGCDIKLSDDKQEVLLKSPGLMIGYYRNEKATEEAFDKDGYYITGDKGLIDENGFLHIVGRLREQFKSSKGKFIVPTKIEKLIVSHPYLEQVCIIGSGMVQPVLVAQLSADAVIGLNDSDILETLKVHILQCNEQLEHHEVVASAWFSRKEWNVNNQLMTPTLKVKRHEVETRFRAFIEDRKKTDPCNMLPDSLLVIEPVKEVNEVA
jgi:long-subunit acyl-CoA synthetase (AMP-forming)